MDRATRRFRAVLTTAVILIALPAFLAGCGGGSTAPSGVHAGGVSADTYVAIVRALKAYGITVTSESDLRMTYGSDRKHVTVTGGGMQVGSKTSTATGTVASVNLELVGKTWRVLNVTGNY